MPNLVILTVSGTVHKTKVEDSTASAAASSSSASTTPGFRAFKRARSGSTSEVTAETFTFNEVLQFIVDDDGTFVDFPILDPELRTSVCSMSVDNNVRLQWLETITLPGDLIAQFTDLARDAASGSFVYAGELSVTKSKVANFTPSDLYYREHTVFTPGTFEDILNVLNTFNTNLQLPQTFGDEVNNARTRNKAPAFESSASAARSLSPSSP